MPINFLNNTSVSAALTVATTLTVGGKVMLGTGTPVRKLELRNITGARNFGIGFNDKDGTQQGTIAIDHNTNDLITATTTNMRFFSGSAIGNIATLPTNQALLLDTSQNATFAGSIAGTSATFDSLSAFPTLTLARSTTHSGISFTAGISNFSGAGADLLFDTVGNSTGFGFRTRDSSGNQQTALVIGPDGNVGVGVAVPLQPLHVIGAGLFTGLVSGITPVAAANFVTKAYVDGSGGGTGPFLPLAGGTMTGNTTNTPGTEVRFGNSSELGIFYSSGVSNIRVNSGYLAIRADDMWFMNQDTALKMRLTSAGDLGIGTDSPGTLHGVTYGTTKLHVDGGTDRGQMILEGDSLAAIIFSDNGATANSRVFATSVDNGDYQIKPLNDNGTSTAGGAAITVLHGGNVGVGTTGPVLKLEVQGTASTPTPFGSAALNGVVRIASGSSNPILDIGSNSAAPYEMWLQAHVPANTYGTPISLQPLGGNVGIGTTSPDSKLDVTGGDITVNTSSISFMTFKHGAVGSENTMGSIHTTGIDLKINATSDLLLLPGSNVGINTTNPSFQLSIENHATTTSTATLEIDGKRTNGTNGAVGELIFSNNGDTFATVAGFRDGADNKGSLQFQTQGAIGFATRMTIATEGAVTLNQYTLTQQTANSVYLLGVDSSGKIVQSTNIPAGSGGTAGPYLPLAGGTMTGATLHGDNVLSRYGTGNDFSIYHNGTDGYLQNETGNLIIPAGNVGIGTQNPVEKLDTPNIAIGGSTITGYTANKLRIDNNGGTSRFYSTGANTTTKGQYVFHVTSSDGSINPEIMRISSAGFVGILTTNPSATFSVANTTIINSNGTGGWGSSANYGFFTWDGGTVNAAIMKGQSGKNFHLGANNRNNDLTIKSTNGNVGIGIGDTTPNAKLAVRGDIAFVGEGVGNCGTRFIKYDCPDASTDNVIAITSAGNVGIGTDAPDVRFHVATSEDGSGIDKGTAKFINTNTGQGATTMHMVQTSSSNFANAVKFWQGSTPTAVGFIRLTTSATQFITSASDLNLKKNITNWDDNTLDKFKALQPKKFRFKTQNVSEDKTLGFIAQNEVSNFPEAYPQFLGEDEKPYYGFNPSGMTTHLMKAIKDLVEKVEILENKITQLENNK